MSAILLIEHNLHVTCMVKGSNITEILGDKVFTIIHQSTSINFALLGCNDKKINYDPPIQ